MPAVYRSPFTVPDCHAPKVARNDMLMSAEQITSLVIAMEGSKNLTEAIPDLKSAAL